VAYYIHLYTIRQALFFYTIKLLPASYDAFKVSVTSTSVSAKSRRLKTCSVNKMVVARDASGIIFKRQV
jgi:hypothetical protein